MSSHQVKYFSVDKKTNGWLVCASYGQEAEQLVFTDINLLVEWIRTVTKENDNGN